jgi:hypothetical protein
VIKTKRPSTIAVNLFIFIIAILLLVPCMATAGQLQPDAPPAPTMKSLGEIYQILQTMQMQINVLMQKTGARFLDNGNGTVTDIRTGLVWLKNANPCGQKNWADASTYCSSLASGQAGLTDGSVTGQWRLPSKAELEGIGTDPPTTWDYGHPSVWTMPAAPFTNVQSNLYWSSAEAGGNATCIWMDSGAPLTISKTGNSNYVWPVRNP